MATSAGVRVRHVRPDGATETASCPSGAATGIAPLAPDTSVVHLWGSWGCPIWGPFIGVSRAHGIQQAPLPTHLSAMVPAC